MDHRILLNTVLAAKIGLKEAIIVNEFMQSSEIGGKEYDGHKFLKGTHEELEIDFPFMSESTIKRCLNKLSKLGLIIIMNLNDDKRDRTNWYAIDYGRYYNIMENE